MIITAPGELGSLVFYFLRDPANITATWIVLRLQHHFGAIKRVLHRHLSLAPGDRAGPDPLHRPLDRNGVGCGISLYFTVLALQLVFEPNLKGPSPVKQFYFI